MPQTESDEERFTRVAAIFDAAGFLQALGVRLEAVGPDWCEMCERRLIAKCISTLTVLDERPLATPPK